jgi:hypothetical protein
VSPALSKELELSNQVVSDHELARLDRHSFCRGFVDQLPHLM